MLICFAAAGDAGRPVHVVERRRLSPTGWPAASPAARDWLAGIGLQGQAGCGGMLLPGRRRATGGAAGASSSPPEPWDAAAYSRPCRPGVWRLADRRRAAAAGPCRRWAGRSPPIASPAIAATRRRAATAGAARRRRRDAGATDRRGDLARARPDQHAGQRPGARRAGRCRRRGGRQRFGAECRRHRRRRRCWRPTIPAIHAVGRASDRAPRLVDLRWGDPAAPQVTLVGKGVCFDTGGLDIKPSSNMLLMKKDMGGAAVMLALARCVMALDLPVRLRLLIPAVENSIGGSRLPPGRRARPCAAAPRSRSPTPTPRAGWSWPTRWPKPTARSPPCCSTRATLTGAARVAVGPELPALFTPDDALAEDLLRDGQQQLRSRSGVCRCTRPTCGYMKSPVADIANAEQQGRSPARSPPPCSSRSSSSETSGWAHLDLFAWNDDSRPGRPRGGEATGAAPASRPDRGALRPQELSCAMSRPAPAEPRRLRPLYGDSDPLDGQRHLRSREQRRLLQLLRHRD